MGAPRLILFLIKKIVSSFDRFFVVKSTAIQPFTELQCKFTKKVSKIKKLGDDSAKTQYQTQYLNASKLKN